jgi:hypothetical protein
MVVLSNSPTIVSGSSRFGGSSSGVVDTVTVSPGDRAAIPRKSMSPATSASLPPLVVTGPVLENKMGAVAMASLAGSWSVMTALAGAASTNTNRAARIRLRIDIPQAIPLQRSGASAAAQTASLADF